MGGGHLTLYAIKDITCHDYVLYSTSLIIILIRFRASPLLRIVEARKTLLFKERANNIIIIIIIIVVQSKDIDIMNDNSIVYKLYPRLSLDQSLFPLDEAYLP